MKLKIKEICGSKGISVAELGRMIGTSKSGIHTILSNGNPTIETLDKIANVLGVSIMDLIEEEKEAFTCPHCGEPIRNKDFLPVVKTQD